MPISGAKSLDDTQLTVSRVWGVLPGEPPVNAGSAAAVNVQRPQRVGARTNDVEACKARRRLGWPGGGAAAAWGAGWLKHLAKPGEVRLGKIL